MHNLSGPNGNKIYKAYPPGLIANGVLLLAGLPLFLLGFVCIKALVTQNHDRTLLLLMGFSLLYNITPVLLAFVRLMGTSLRLDSIGIEHQRIELQQTASIVVPFTFKIRKVFAKWDEIYEVGWLPKEPIPPVGFTPKLTVVSQGQGDQTTRTNCPMIIKTKAGNIVFCVMFHPRINAEIMEAILARAPQLNKAVII